MKPSLVQPEPLGLDSLDSTGPSRQDQVTSVQGLSSRWSCLGNQRAKTDHHGGVRFRALSRSVVGNRRAFFQRFRNLPALLSSPQTCPVVSCFWLRSENAAMWVPSRRWLSSFHLGASRLHHHRQHWCVQTVVDTGRQLQGGDLEIGLPQGVDSRCVRNAWR